MFQQILIDSFSLIFSTSQDSVLVVTFSFYIFYILSHFSYVLVVRSKIFEYLIVDLIASITEKRKMFPSFNLRLCNMCLLFTSVSDRFATLISKPAAPTPTDRAGEPANF